METREHASTFGANPVTAAPATLEVVKSEKLLKVSKKMGVQIKKALRIINGRFENGLVAITAGRSTVS